MFVFMRNALSAAAIVLASNAAQVPALAQTQVANFYKGKTMEMIVPTSPGGDYDLRARLVSRHLGRLIPGNPTIIVKNMPGGLGVAASNYMYNIAPKDGTSLQIIFQNMPILQAVKQPGVQFDVREFGWLGNTTNTPNIINSWHTTGILKIEDVLEKELIVGAPGAMSTSYIYPIALNQTIGTKFKVVTGYAGGNLVNLAMEKGEVGGRGSNSWASWKSGHPQWLTDKKIHLLVQVGLTRATDLPDVPLLLELAKNDADREFLTFLSADMGISRAFTTTPGVPRDRLAALQKAFMDTMRDKEVLAEADKTKHEIDPNDGDAALKISTMMINTRPEVLERYKALIAGVQ
jgi:tripartite-type tricarboxylate transporter receptor subunit TctC